MEIVPMFGFKTVLKNQRTKWSLLNNLFCVSLSTYQEISVDFVVGMSKEVVCIETIDKLPINN